MIGLKEKMEKDSGFHKQMQDSEYKYQMMLQKAIYSDLSSIPPLIVDAGKTLSNDQIFFFFGWEIEGKVSAERVFMYTVKWLEQKFQKGLNTFTIVYFHTSCNSYTSYIAFRKTIRSLSPKYYERLKSIIIMNPSFTVRAMEWFITGTLNKYLSGITKFASSIKDLSKYNIQLNIQATLFPQTVWKQFYSNKDSKKTITEAKSTVLSKTVLRLNDLNDYQTNQLGIPLIFQFLISYFILKPSGLKQQGLFRKSVSVDDISEATAELAKFNYEYINEITNPHLVANLIKRSLTDLKDPIMTYEIYEQLTHDGGRSTEVGYIKKLMQTLPLKNYVSIVFLFQFFINEVIPLSQFNKMTNYNVAVILAPCLMRSAKNAIEDLIYSKKVVLVLEFILENFEEIFGSNEQKEEVFRSSARIEEDKFYRESLSINEGDQKQLLIEPPKLRTIDIQQFNRFSFLDNMHNEKRKMKKGVENVIFPFH